MSKSYHEEVSENLTAYVTECVFVGYKIRDTKGKQTIAFRAITWFTIC